MARTAAPGLRIRRIRAGRDRRLEDLRLPALEERVGAELELGATGSSWGSSRRWSPSIRCASGFAISHARALSGGSSGRRSSRLPGRPRGPCRRAGHRAESRAQAAARCDPSPGSNSRPGGTAASGSRSLRRGHSSCARWTARHDAGFRSLRRRCRQSTDRRRGRDRRAPCARVRLSAGGRTRPAACLAVRRRQARAQARSTTSSTHCSTRTTSPGPCTGFSQSLRACCAARPRNSS